MIKNLSITKKLLVLVGFKMIVLAIFATWMLLNKYDLYSNMDQLGYDMELVTYTSKLIHETQKERGMTAGFIGSKGTKFAYKIKDQRSLTDKRLSEIKKFYSEHKFKANIKSKVDDVLNRLDRLSQIRSEVNSLSIKLGDALKYYTKTNAVMLEMVVEISKSSNSKIISQEINAFYNFLQAKERAGIERAVGANALAKKAWSGGLKNKYVSLIAQQDAFIKSFLDYALIEEKAFYNNTLKGESINNVNRIRAKLLKDTFDEESTYWFGEITKKINLLKKVDDYMAKDLLASIEKEKKSAFNGLVLVLAIGVIGWLMVIFITYLVIKDITGKIKRFEKGLLGFFSFIKKEQTDAEYIDINSSDELGEMAKAVNENIKVTQELIQSEKAFIDSVNSVVGDVRRGKLDSSITVHVNSEGYERLKHSFNTMLNDLQSQIANDLNCVSSVLQKYANKDFTSKIDDTGDFSKKINDLSDIINHMLLENKRNGVMLQTSSSTLLDNVDQLNQSSNQAAARLEETAAALEEMTSNVRSNTENIAQMNQLAKQVTTSANQGQELASKTATSMDEINEQVSSINEAISVIDQIAFQTNILSLNAAVEAATAGEAGKGFAVVAQEVRNLASRSAEAAKDIKDLVESATNKANEGKNISDEMIKGYTGLNENINKTIELIKSVDVASKEQQQGIEQINDAVNSLDAQTQENASIASQTQSIANETSQKANDLVQEADSMNFVGKESINSVVKTSISNSTYKPKKETPNSNSKHKNEITVISSTNEEDEWASF